MNNVFPNMNTADQIIRLHLHTSKQYRQVCELMYFYKDKSRTSEGCQDRYTFLDGSFLEIPLK